MLEYSTNSLMRMNHFVLALFLGGAVVQHGGEELQVQLKYDYVTLFYLQKVPHGTISLWMISK